MNKIINEDMKYILNINTRIMDRPLVIEEERLNFDDEENEEKTK